MNFPEIIACLVSDDVRDEGRGKATILGFLGLAPHVSIIINDIAKPIDRLVFTFLTKPFSKSGKFDIGLRLQAPNGDVIKEDKGLQLIIEEAGKTARFTLGYMRPKFNTIGSHQITVLVDG